MCASPIGLKLSSSYHTSRRQLESSMKRLAAGDKLAEVGKDPGNLALSSKIRYLMAKEEYNLSNITQNLAFLRTTDAYLDIVAESIVRMETLAAGATNPLLTAAELLTFDDEFQFCKQELSSLARQSLFQDKPIILERLSKLALTLEPMR
jgi:flagellin-like hook-associated protein FlgL